MMMSGDDRKSDEWTIIKCAVCSSDFTQIAHFKRHVEDSECDGNGSIVVKINREVDENKTEADKKVEDILRGHLVICQFCDKKFISRKVLFGHEKTCEKSRDLGLNRRDPLKCQFCGKVLKNKRSAGGHIFACKKRRKNSGVKSAKKGLKSNGNCRFCDKNFVSKEILFSHESLCEENPDGGSLDYGQGSMKVENDLICQFCKEVSKNSLDAQKHVLICRQTQTNFGVDISKEWPKNGGNCRFCNKNFISREILCTHESLCEENPAKGNLDLGRMKVENDLKCPFCEKVSKNSQSAGKHMFTCRQRQINFGVAIPGWYLKNNGNCKFCGKIFSRKMNLINHYFICDARFLTGVECDNCGFKFTSQRKFFTHSMSCKRSSSSSNTLHLSCNKCGNSYESMKLLEIHFKGCHNDANLVGGRGSNKCSKCGKSYTNCRSFVKHNEKCQWMKKRKKMKNDIKVKSERAKDGIVVKAERGTSEILKKCRLCPEKFTDLKTWKIHAKKVHAKGHFLVCPKCDFFQSKNINDIVKHVEQIHDNPLDDKNLIREESFIETEVDPLA